MSIGLLQICKKILSKLKVIEPRPLLILQESFITDLNYKLSNKCGNKSYHFFIILNLSKTRKTQLVKKCKKAIYIIVYTREKKFAVIHNNYN